VSPNPRQGGTAPIFRGGRSTRRPPPVGRRARPPYGPCGAVPCGQCAPRPPCRLIPVGRHGS